MPGFKQAQPWVPVLGESSNHPPPPPYNQHHHFYEGTNWEAAGGGHLSPTPKQRRKIIRDNLIRACCHINVLIFLLGRRDGRHLDVYLFLGDRLVHLPKLKGDKSLQEPGAVVGTRGVGLLEDVLGQLAVELGSDVRQVRLDVDKLLVILVIRCTKAAVKRRRRGVSSCYIGSSGHFHRGVEQRVWKNKIIRQASFFS